MLLILLILIAICVSLWLTRTGDPFYENALPLCFAAVLLWLLILLVFTFILPTYYFETEVKIDGYHYDSSFPYDSLSYIQDGTCVRISGNITIFDGGAKDTLVIKDNYIDVPEWFWLISFMDISGKPWNTDYFIR